jgi:hypothetical protein
MPAAKLLEVKALIKLVHASYRFMLSYKENRPKYFSEYNRSLKNLDLKTLSESPPQISFRNLWPAIKQLFAECSHPTRYGKWKICGYDYTAMQHF